MATNSSVAPINTSINSIYCKPIGYNLKLTAIVLVFLGMEILVLLDYILPFGKNGKFINAEPVIVRLINCFETRLEKAQVFWFEYHTQSLCIISVFVEFQYRPSSNIEVGLCVNSTRNCKSNEF